MTVNTYKITDLNNWTQASSSLCGSTSEIAKLARRLADLGGGGTAEKAELEGYLKCLQETERLLNVDDNTSCLFIGLTEGPERNDAVAHARNVVTHLLDAVKQLNGIAELQSPAVANDVSTEQAILATANTTSVELELLKAIKLACANTPILLLNRGTKTNLGTASALIARLAVTPYTSPQPGIHPHLGFNGFTGFSRLSESAPSKSDDESWESALANAWTVSGFSNADQSRPKSFLWRIEAFSNEPDLAFERFHQRSCEAAFVCALWAASGGIPGDKDTDLLLSDMDPLAGVTAMLNMNQIKGADTTLLPISGFIAKLQAAAKAKLEVVIVAKGQMENIEKEENPERKKDGDRMKELDEAILKQVEVKEVETVGEAFQELIVQGRLTRWYTSGALANWNERFYEIDDEGNRIAGPESVSISAGNDSQAST
jgi:hypothetical protein